MISLNPLDIPLIQIGIAFHLPLKDLATCCRLNKAWNDIAMPLLWATLNTHGSPFSTFSFFKNPSFESALKRHKDNIQHLLLSQYAEYSAFALPYPRLTVLSAQVVESTQLSQLTNLVALNPTIVSFTLSFKQLVDRSEWAIFDILPNLRNLKFTSVCAILSNELLTRILVRCPHLERLHIECNPSRFNGSENDFALSTLINTHLPPQLALREITFERVILPFVILLLSSSRCSNLVKLTIPTMNSDELEQLCSVLEDSNSKCPRLAVLNFFRMRGVRGGVFTRIVYSCRNIALKEFDLPWGSTSRHTIETLWKYHGASLETLRATRCAEDITSQDVAAVVASCPRLKVLHLQGWSNSVPLMAQDIIATHSSNSSLPWASSWSCYNLVELRVAIFGICAKTNGNCSVHEDCQATQKQVYCLLSQLQQLRVLDVGCSSSIVHSVRQKGGLEWTLTSGMDQLYTLRSLTELGVRQMEHSMGVLEFVWMKEHWPRLNCVQGIFGGRHKTDEIESWLQEHWSRLSWS